MKNINLTINEAEFCLEALKALIQLHYDQLVICSLWPEIRRRWGRLELGDIPLMKDRLAYLLKNAKEFMWVIKDPVTQERVCRCISPEDLSERFEVSQMIGLEYVWISNDSVEDPVMHRIHKSLFIQVPVKPEEKKNVEDLKS